MKLRGTWIVSAVVIALLMGLAALSAAEEPVRYFGPGPGVPEMDDKYFKQHYPADQWGVYGYGTGHMGMGYGPYIYSEPKPGKPLEQPPDYGLAVIKPHLNWTGGDKVEVSAPPNAPTVSAMTVDVVGYSGAVLHTGTVTAPPFTILAILPEGSAMIRVNLTLVDGFSASTYPIVPAK